MEISRKKMDALEEKTGRKIVWAKALNNQLTEFITPDDKHFMYSKTSETFRQLYGEDVKHTKLCP